MSWRAWTSTGEDGMTELSDFIENVLANVYNTTPALPGITGTKGPTGTQGITGSRGVTGQHGITGMQGITGDKGITGMVGITGSQGYGVPGPTGTAGVTGIAGITGAQGSQGITGSQGVTGPQGGQGLTGAQGITGTAGLTGSVGITGTAGVTGSQVSDPYVNTLTLSGSSNQMLVDTTSAGGGYMYINSPGASTSRVVTIPDFSYYSGPAMKNETGIMYQSALSIFSGSGQVTTGETGSLLQLTYPAGGPATVGIDVDIGTRYMIVVCGTLGNTVTLSIPPGFAGSLYGTVTSSTSTPVTGGNVIAKSNIILSTSAAIGDIYEIFGLDFNHFYLRGNTSVPGSVTFT